MQAATPEIDHLIVCASAGSGCICGDARHARAHGGQGRAARHRALGAGSPIPRHAAAAQVLPNKV